MKKINLGQKITGLLSITLLVAISVSGFISAISQGRLIERQLHYTTSVFALNLSEKVEGFIEKHVEVLEALAIVNDVTSRNIIKQKEILASFHSHYDDFSVMFITDVNGMQIVRSDDNDLSSVADRDYFKSTYNQGETVISDVIISKTTGKPAVVIATPVRHSTGNIIGVIAATLDLSQIEQYRSEVVMGRTGYAFITDKTGVILVHPDQTMVDERTNVSDVEIVEAALSGENGTRAYKYKEQEVFGGYTTVPSTGWPVVVRQSYDEAYEPVVEVQTTTIIVGLILLLVIVIIGYLFSKWLAKPLKVLTQSAEKLSMGNLTDEIIVNTKDEIGQLAHTFERMRLNLKELVSQIVVTTKDVEIASKNVLTSTIETEKVSVQISGVIGELAKGSEDQSNNLQKTSMAMNNIVVAIDDIASSSLNSYESSSKATELVNSGSEVVKEQDMKMVETTNAVKQVADVIQKLSEKASEIEHIVEVIQGVSQQTNLLALNAAIEAARAGEQGKGFAVVAEEVRKLAEESGVSTSKIQNIINDIQITTKSAVDSVKSTEAAITEQNRAVIDTSNIFHDILEMVTTISKQVQGVSNATDQVKKESQYILENIESISSVSEETAASTEEVTASTEEQSVSIQYIVTEIERLNELTNNLDKSTKSFQI